MYAIRSYYGQVIGGRSGRVRPWIDKIFEVKRAYAFPADQFTGPDHARGTGSSALKLRTVNIMTGRTARS